MGKTLSELGPSQLSIFIVQSEGWRDNGKSEIKWKNHRGSNEDSSQYSPCTKIVE